MDRRVRHHSSLRLTESQVLAFLGAIEAPVLLIRAEKSFPVDPVIIDARLAAIQRVHTLTLPGGHHLHLDESPDAVAAAIRAFLSAAG